MAFRCGQNYTDSKNMFKKIIILKSKPVKYIECNKKYESRFAKYTFTNEKKHESKFWNLSRRKWSAFSLSRLEFFFQLDSRFIFRLKFQFFFSFVNIYFVNLDSFFYCIRFILQVSTYVLCFQHVFTIGIILSATERHRWHSHEFKMVDDGLRCKNFISHECFAYGLDN